MNSTNIQEQVKEVVQKYTLEISPELRYIDLTSEVGELGKELLKATQYGKKEFNITDNTDNTESEIGDVLFSTICIANSLDIDIEKALNGVIKKYEDRFNYKGSIGLEHRINNN